MEYSSAIKKNTFESVLMRWMKLEPIIQSEVSQKEKHQYSMKAVTQSCLTLCDHMDCSPPVSSVHGISQARILEWVAMPFSKGIFPTQGPSLASPELADGFFTPDHLGSPHALISIS